MDLDECAMCVLFSIVVPEIEVIYLNKCNTPTHTHTHTTAFALESGAECVDTNTRDMNGIKNKQSAAATARRSAISPHISLENE